VWKSPKEFCELMWEHAFVYEEVVLDAYTFAWNTEFDPHNITHDENPNNRVQALKPYPPTCGSFSSVNAVRPATLLCTSVLCLVKSCGNAASCQAAARFVCH
jgi:hypothetical protein